MVNHSLQMIDEMLHDTTGNNNALWTVWTAWK